MSAVIEQVQPKVYTPVNYYDKRKVTTVDPRWVWFPGDLIVPERKAEVECLAVGGEETPSPCLQRYGRGFVPRGRAAILELGGDPIPRRHLGDLNVAAWYGIAGAEADKNEMGLIPVFPGDGLRVLKRYSMNPIRKGMDELTCLMGKEWDECHNSDSTGILDVVERAMYGDGFEPTLRGLEDQIRSAVINDSRIDIGKLKAEKLAMCNDFRNWGMRMITVEHGLLKTGHVGEWQGGWSYSYSPITEMLMAQLEVTRQDQPMHEMSKLIAQILPQQQAQSSGLSAADMELFERRLEEKLTAVRAADAGRIAELEAQLKANNQSTTYTCEHCGDEVKLSVKGLHVGRHCRVLHPKES